MLDRFKCNGAMANSFRVFLLSPLVQSINSALNVWPGDLQLLVELKQCANKKKSKVHQRSLNLLGCIIQVPKLLKCIFRSPNLFQGVTQVHNLLKCSFRTINLSRGDMQLPKLSRCYFHFNINVFATLNLTKIAILNFIENGNKLSQ